MTVLGSGLLDVRSWFESIRYVTEYGPLPDRPVYRDRPAAHLWSATSATAAFTSTGARRNTSAAWGVAQSATGTATSPRSNRGRTVS